MREVTACVTHQGKQPRRLAQGLAFRKYPVRVQNVRYYPGVLWFLGYTSKKWRRCVYWRPGRVTKMANPTRNYKFQKSHLFHFLLFGSLI